jgi:hypothetical protein
MEERTTIQDIYDRGVWTQCVKILGREEGRERGKTGPSRSGRNVIRQQDGTILERVPSENRE